MSMSSMGIIAIFRPNLRSIISVAGAKWLKQVLF